MSERNSGFNALVYLFDNVIAEKLGYSYNQYIEIIDTMSDDDSVFILESVFEYIVLEDEGSQIPDNVQRDLDEAIAMFNEQAQIINNEKLNPND